MGRKRSELAEERDRERDAHILCGGFARANNRVNKEREATASAVLSCGFHFRISSFHHTHHRRIAPKPQCTAKLCRRGLSNRATSRIAHLHTLYEEIACANLQTSLISRLGCGQTFSEFSRANDRWLIKSESGRRLFMPVSREIAVSAHKLIGAGGQGEKSRL